MLKFLSFLIIIRDKSSDYYYWKVRDCYTSGDVSLMPLKNPFWGTPTETSAKVEKFYGTDLIFKTMVVSGAREGVQALKDMGFRLVIVTARAEDKADESWEWVNRHFPGAKSISM